MMKTLTFLNDLHSTENNWRENNKVKHKKRKSFHFFFSFFSQEPNRELRKWDTKTLPVHENFVILSDSLLAQVAFLQKITNLPLRFLLLTLRRRQRQNPRRRLIPLHRNARRPCGHRDPRSRTHIEPVLRRHGRRRRQDLVEQACVAEAGGPYDPQALRCHCERKLARVLQKQRDTER